MTEQNKSIIQLEVACSDGIYMYIITSNPLLQFILKQFQQQNTLTHKQFTDREQLKGEDGHNVVVFYYRVHRGSILHHTVFSKVLSASWNLPQNYFQHFPTTKIVPDHNINDNIREDSNV